jgi:transcriptional regulator with XRE-family HTH domain
MRSLSKVLDLWPGSLRSLAREAGVSHVTLLRLRAGEAVSADTMKHLADAFDRAAEQCLLAKRDLLERIK